MQQELVTGITEFDAAKSLRAINALKPGTTIDAPQGVFPRIVEEEAQQKAAG